MTTNNAPESAPIPDSAKDEMLIRCSDCDGTLMYKATDEGYLVFHDCLYGKHGNKKVKDAIAAGKQEGFTQGAEKATDAAVDECARHAQFCKSEMLKGGDYEHLKTRMDEAAYLADRIRNALPSAGLAHAEVRSRAVRNYQQNAKRLL